MVDQSLDVLIEAQLATMLAIVNMVDNVHRDNRGYIMDSKPLTDMFMTISKLEALQKQRKGPE